MNSNLEQLDKQVEMLTEQIKDGILVRWAHQGYSDYVDNTSTLIREDIYLFEQSFELYEERSLRNTILSKLRAILNDTKNLLLSRDVDRGVNDFLREFLVLVNNWNMMGEEDKNISADIEAVLRIFEIIGTLFGLLERLNHSAAVIEERLFKAESFDKPFKTSSTYLQAIKESLDKTTQEKSEE